MKRILVKVIFLFIAGYVHAQIDSSLLSQSKKTVDSLSLNMDAVYSRPFMNNQRTTSVGGYLEANWQHLGTDGVSEGHQFQFRRMTLFVASSITDQITFMSEIEFEEGGKEIAIEFAALDISFHPLLNVRSGIVMNPIGAFNQNHDGPKWEFTDRPIAATQLLPATWSNVGFGLFGQYYKKDWKFGYEVYATSGFDPSIIENEMNKTYLPAAKRNTDRFEEGNVLFTTKLAVRHKKIGELGLSYMGGQYSTDLADGIVVDEKRHVHAAAVDFSTLIPKSKTFITGEWTRIWLDVPANYSPQFGNIQSGGFIDIVQPIITRKIFHYTKAVINFAIRLEQVDWNVGTFKDTNGRIGDELVSVLPGISFRPTQETVLRLNYRLMQETDFLNNPPANTAGFSFGVSSYF